MTDTFKIPRKADNRCKCRKCHRWMRYHVTEKTPVRRSNPPRASICADCWREMEMAI